MEYLTPSGTEDRADLIVSGSSTLTSPLLEHGLADEVNLIVHPVLLGTGKRFFAEGTPARAFTLDSTQAFPWGIVLNTYKAAGPLQNLKIRTSTWMTSFA